MYLTTNVAQPAAPGNALVQRINWTTGQEIRDTAGMGCGCAGGCKGIGCAGLGQLFSSGWDVSGWGLPEWGIVVFGAYVVFSVFSTTSRGVSKVRSGVARRRSRSKRKKELQEELRRL